MSSSEKPAAWNAGSGFLSRWQPSASSCCRGFRSRWPRRSQRRSGDAMTCSMNRTLPPGLSTRRISCTAAGTLGTLHKTCGECCFVRATTCLPFARMSCTANLSCLMCNSLQSQNAPSRRYPPQDSAQGVWMSSPCAQANPFSLADVYMGRENLRRRVRHSSKKQCLDGASTTGPHQGAYDSVKGGVCEGQFLCDADCQLQSILRESGSLRPFPGILKHVWIWIDADDMQTLHLGGSKQ